MHAYCDYVYLLIIFIIPVILQAAGGLNGVREGGALRVVLGAPETIFPQLVTFWRTKKETEKQVLNLFALVAFDENFLILLKGAIFT